MILFMDHVSAVAEEYGMFEATSWSDFHRGGVLDIEGGNQTLGYSRQYIQNLLDDRTCAGDPGLAPNSPVGYWTGGNRCAAGVDSRFGMFQEDSISSTVETNTAAYVRLDFAFDNLPKRVAGNIGLRYIELDRKATGFVHSPGMDEFFPGTGRDLPAGQTAPLNGPDVLAFAQSQVDAGNYAELDDFYTSVDNQWATQAFWYLSDEERAFATKSSLAQSASNKYTAWLPSLNVKVELTDDLIGRFAVSKAMAQPGMDSVQNRITSSAQLEVTPGIPADVMNAARWETAPQSASVIAWEGSGGNPFLEPMESIQYDASLGWYFADASSLTGTLFYKDLSNFFVSGATPQQLTNGLTGQTQTANVSSQTNGGDGKMYGYELAYTQFFDNLPSFWSGLGMQANYTWVKANGVPPNVDTSFVGVLGAVDLDTVPLVGQSEHTANLVLMYQRDNWSGRVAYNWRSEYLVSYRDGVTNFPVWQDSAGVMDASLTYDVNDNLSLVLQATNLLDSESNLSYIIDNEGTRAGKSWFIAERQAVVGVRLRF
jgi:iron complex outermembrane recepter protein